MAKVFEIRLSQQSTVLPSRLIGRLVWDAAARVKSRTMAFQYDSAWLRVGFSIGSDLPLKDGVQYLSVPYGNPGRSIDLYDRRFLFGFVADTAPGLWWTDWLQSARINRVEMPHTECLSSPDELWTSLGSNLRRFSALSLSLVHSEQTKSEIDYFEKKTFADVVNALQRLRDAPDTLTKSQLRLLEPLLSDLGGRSVKALISEHSKSGLFSDWVLRPSERSTGVNSARWQAIGMALASRCGISTVENKYIESTSGGGYLEKRFDRDERGRSLFCLSAATLVMNRQRPGQTAVVSGYADIADILNRSGVHPAEDLRDLFHRLLFDTLTGNRHTEISDFWFAREASGWKLVPFHGVRLLVPQQRVRLLNTPIIKNDTSADPDLAVSVSRYFGVTLKDAKAMKLDMLKVISDWRTVAAEFKATKAEITAMAGSFV